MSITATNLLNIALMLVSGLVAWWLPFETFLFAYAVLGPLHYLTEISWLHDRRFFTTGRRDWIAALLPCIPLTIFYVAKVEGPISDGFKIALTWLAFAAAAAAVVAGPPRRRLLVGAAVFVAGVVFVRTDVFLILVGVFLPTLIHVFVFTALFIVVGALKSRSLSGWCSLGVHLAIPAALLAAGTVAPHYAPSQDSFDKSQPFHGVAALLVSGLDSNVDSRMFVVGMQCVAYAYTYHYLNWFSKTKVIGWHLISRRRLALILVAWAASVVLYAIDYRLGFSALFALSLAHVFLEFPLNIRTFGMIGAGLGGRRLSPAAAD